MSQPDDDGCNDVDDDDDEDDDDDDGRNEDADDHFDVHVVDHRKM